MASWKMEQFKEDGSIHLTTPESFIFSFRSTGHLLEQLAHLASAAPVTMDLKFGDAVEIVTETRKIYLVRPDAWHNGEFKYDALLGTTEELAKVMVKFLELKLNGEL